MQDELQFDEKYIANTHFAVKLLLSHFVNLHQQYLPLELLDIALFVTVPGEPEVVVEQYPLPVAVPAGHVTVHVLAEASGVILLPLSVGNVTVVVVVDRYVPASHSVPEPEPEPEPDPDEAVQPVILLPKHVCIIPVVPPTPPKIVAHMAAHIYEQ